MRENPRTNCRHWADFGIVSKSDAGENFMLRNGEFIFYQRSVFGCMVGHLVGGIDDSLELI